jgi:hypothetical protein
MIYFNVKIVLKIVIRVKVKKNANSVKICFSYLKIFVLRNAQINIFKKIKFVYRATNPVKLVLMILLLGVKNVLISCKY